jgi:type I restriction enzyme M protein
MQHGRIAHHVVGRLHQARELPMVRCGMRRADSARPAHALNGIEGYLAPQNSPSPIPLFPIPCRACVCSRGHRGRHQGQPHAAGAVARDGRLTQGNSGQGQGHVQIDHLAGALPQGYVGLPNDVLQELLRLLAPLKIEGDAYGLVFEYFMGQFASSFMQKGGEYFTPASIVKLIVEVIEPYHGMILDPACGSGGMFVHSAEFVRRHHKSPTREISIYGVEKMSDTLRLCRMNLAVHGLSGDLREANSYYDDPHKLIGRFDYVMANPPFNQPEVDRAKLVNEAGKVDPRFPLRLPTVNNANYIWINLFYAALNPIGRAGFVMANSAADAGGSEREIRKRLIEGGAVDCIIAVGPNMFFTVTLPVTLWFLDRGKAKGERGDKVLFIDARHLFRQVTRANRVFDPDHIEFIGNVVRLWRDEKVETDAGSGARLAEAFPDACYRDVPGVCKVVRRTEIEAQDWSLNPGRYVGIAPGQPHDTDGFKEKLEALQEELETLTAQAHQLEQTIARNVVEVLEA